MSDDAMNNNSIKQMKKLFTEMFADHYKKTCELYRAHEKYISDIILVRAKP